MAMLTNAFNVEFTPAEGPFDVRVSGGQAQILKKIPGDAIFESGGIIGSISCLVDNPQAGTIYKFLNYNNSAVSVFAGQ